MTSAPLQILVCEDDPVQSRIMQAAIENKGYQMLGPCRTPEQAAELSSREGVGAAILDVTLIGGHVAETAQILVDRGVPFAFITGYGPQVWRVLRAFPDQLTVPKPASLDTIELVLDSLLIKEPA